MENWIVLEAKQPICLNLSAHNVTLEEIVSL